MDDASCCQNLLQDRCDVAFSVSHCGCCAESVYAGQIIGDHDLHVSRVYDTIAVRSYLLVTVKLAPVVVMAIADPLVLFAPSSPVRPKGIWPAVAVAETVTV